nr:MAG: hypothetical protein [Bacteriophage sp.]
MAKDFRVAAWHLKGRAQIGDNVQVVCYCAQSHGDCDWRVALDADLWQPKSVTLKFGPNPSVACSVSLANDSTVETVKRAQCSFGTNLNMVITGHIKNIVKGDIERGEIPDNEFWIIEGISRIE